MKIDVQQGGQWIDLSTGKPDTGTTTPPVASAPTATSTASRPAAGTFDVRVSVQPDPTRDGRSTTITATTTPGASCTVRVVYPSGAASGSAALKAAQTADSGGRVSWTWKPSTRRAGTATATVSCTLGGKSATGSTQFTIQ